jgi:hypothetical protein
MAKRRRRSSASTKVRIPCYLCMGIVPCDPPLPPSTSASTPRTQRHPGPSRAWGGTRCEDPMLDHAVTCVLCGIRGFHEPGGVATRVDPAPHRPHPHVPAHPGLSRAWEAVGRTSRAAAWHSTCAELGCFRGFHEPGKRQGARPRWICMPRSQRFRTRVAPTHADPVLQESHRPPTSKRSHDPTTPPALPRHLVGLSLHLCGAMLTPTTAGTG